MNNSEKPPNINESRFNIRMLEGKQAYYLDLFGNYIAEREGYNDKSLKTGGIETVYFYLIHKFNWLPRDVRSMSIEDVLFVLSEEMHGWQPAGEDSYTFDDFKNGLENLGRLTGGSM